MDYLGQMGVTSHLLLLRKGHGISDTYIYETVYRLWTRSPDQIKSERKSTATRVLLITRLVGIPENRADLAPGPSAA